jgi:hypothetical protein
LQDLLRTGGLAECGEGTVYPFAAVKTRGILESEVRPIKVTARERRRNIGDFMSFEVG